MRIPIKVDQESKKKVKKDGETTDADVLFNPIQSIVLEYLDPDKGYPVDKKSSEERDKLQRNKFQYRPKLTLLGNLIPSYAIQIAHNLLWHIDIEETLKFAEQNRAALLEVVEIKDPHGQRVRGTPLQILAAAGDRNLARKGKVEKDYGLVERLHHCFPEGSRDSEKQLNDWFERDVDKEQTNKTMAPYMEAMRILCQEIAASKEITDKVPFEVLLKLPIAEKFRKALKPDPQHVVTSGLLFDLQIFQYYYNLLQSNTYNPNGHNIITDVHRNRPLGELYGLKSELFNNIVLPTLQARVQRIDLEILKKGYRNVFERNRETPDRIDFSFGIPPDLEGLGMDFYINHEGNREYLTPDNSIWVGIIMVLADPTYENYFKQKHQSWSDVIISSTYPKAKITNSMMMHYFKVFPS